MNTLPVSLLFMRYLTILLLLVFALPASAQEWITRPADQLLTRSALEQAVIGQTLVFHDNGTSEFGVDGHYAYTYGGGGTWLGTYELGDDSTICVTFVTGTLRCDLYVHSGERLVLITADGLRFPIRP